MKDFVDSINPALVLLGSSLSLVATMLSILLVRMQWKLEQSKQGTTTLPQVPSLRLILLIFGCCALVGMLVISAFSIPNQASTGAAKESATQEVSQAQTKNIETTNFVKEWNKLIELAQEIDSKKGTSFSLQDTADQFQFTQTSEHIEKNAVEKAKSQLRMELMRRGMPNTLQVTKIHWIKTFAEKKEGKVQSLVILFDANVPKNGDSPEERYTKKAIRLKDMRFGTTEQMRSWINGLISYLEECLIAESSRDPALLRAPISPFVFP